MNAKAMGCSEVTDEGGGDLYYSDKRGRARVPRNPYIFFCRFFFVVVIIIIYISL